MLKRLLAALATDRASYGLLESRVESLSDHTRYVAAVGL